MKERVRGTERIIYLLREHSDEFFIRGFLRLAKLLCQLVDEIECPRMTLVDKVRLMTHDLPDPAKRGNRGFAHRNFIHRVGEWSVQLRELLPPQIGKRALQQLLRRRIHERYRLIVIQSDDR